MSLSKKKTKTLNNKYSPSEPCNCEICLGYCQRPGWWTVEEAKKAIDAGLANCMVLTLCLLNAGFAILSVSGWERNVIMILRETGTLLQGKL
jgi:hypothetical protein